MSGIIGCRPTKPTEIEPKFCYEYDIKCEGFCHNCSIRKW